MKNPRVISLVPSWTETLLEAGANVVGRSRFCIHPFDPVSKSMSRLVSNVVAAGSLPAVGGTKDLKLEAIRALKPDLIVLDREENTLAMAQALREIAPLHVSHVRSLGEMPAELRALAAVLGAGGTVGAGSVGVEELAVNSPAVALENFARRFEVVQASLPLKFGDLASVSGPVIYAIWKDPWMAVTRATYIGSMLEAVGVSGDKIWPAVSGESAAANYPPFNLEDLPANATVLLSSEPYPFHRKIDEVKRELGERQVLLVDGESFSWFGIRSLRFLEGLVK